MRGGCGLCVRSNVTKKGALLTSTQSAQWRQKEHQNASWRQVASGIGIKRNAGREENDRLVAITWETANLIC